MRGKELEAAIIRAIVDYLADRVLERLGRNAAAVPPRTLPAPAVYGKTERAKTGRAETGWTETGRVFGREDAVLCLPDSEVRLSRKTLITPFAADELARRRVRVIRHQ